MKIRCLGGGVALGGLCALLVAAAEPAAVPAGATTAAPIGITADDAVAIAVNDVRATSDGFRLTNPRHTATFARAGVAFVPRAGGPGWRWNLASVAAGRSPLRVVRLGPRPPELAGRRVVAFGRGAIVERYVARPTSLEQQFVLPRALPLGSRDLVIRGRVFSTGAFDSTPTGWRWRTRAGAVSLGRVSVYDADGRALAARMEATRTSTTIVVSGRALRTAAYPVTVDPEIGADDFQVSAMSDGNLNYFSRAPAVAYNPVRHEYLVVWDGDKAEPPLVDGENEIFGQRIDAATGADVGAYNFRISDVGPQGDVAYGATSPAVVHNAAADEYLVVWCGNDDLPGMARYETEVFGQRLSGTGAEVGFDDFRISMMGPSGDSGFAVAEVAASYNARTNEYLVAWAGEEGPPTYVHDEYEIFAQRLTAAGAEIGADDFPVSDTSTIPAGLRPSSPAIATASSTGEYLVVWSGGQDVTGELEIFGQRLGPAGAEVGADDFRISDMGPEGSTSHGARAPAVAYNPQHGEYLVVWEGVDVGTQHQVYGQRLDAATGDAVGANDFAVSTTEQSGGGEYLASPAVAYGAATDEYLVVWWASTAPFSGVGRIHAQRLTAAGTEIGVNDQPVTAAGSVGQPAVAWAIQSGQWLVAWHGQPKEPPYVGSAEVFAQRLAAGGAEIGEDDFRISESANANPAFDGTRPAVAFNARANEYLVVWEGDDKLGRADDEFEIWGQRVNAVTGESVGEDDFRISDMGPWGDPNWDAHEPAVTYNPNLDEYLVVWRGDGVFDDDFEIWGQRLTRAGARVGTNGFVISDMGTPGNPTLGAADPAAVFNPSTNEYLVVWEGDDVVDGDYEIYAQRLTATGGQTGANDFRLSDMGAAGATAAALDPALAVEPSGGEYLVVWEGDDAPGEFEIYGQRLTPSGAATGADDFPISHAGTAGDPTIDALDPAVSAGSTGYLVAWAADAPPLAEDEFEIFGQRVTASGAATSATDLRISAMGADGDPTADALVPALGFNPRSNEYGVAWAGDDAAGALADDEYEIYFETIDASTGNRTGHDDVRVSAMGTDGAPAFDAAAPTVAAANREFLVAWDGDDDVPPHADDARDVYAQRLGVGGPTAAELLSLRATRERGCIVLRWRIGAAPGTVAFAVSRATGRGTTRALGLVVARPGMPGRGYRFRDCAAPRRFAAAYEIAAVHVDGTRRPLGRVRA